MDILAGLNPAQQEAVTVSLDQHGAIIAGAGTGKTRVLVHRIAFLLQQDVEPSRILAVTFTNKAAKEMRERLSKMVDHSTAASVRLGTFHSIGLRIIMRYGNLVGLPHPNRVQVLDQDDGMALLRRVIKDHFTDTERKTIKAADAYSQIISWKEQGYTPSSLPPLRLPDELSIAKLFAPYEKEKTASNAVDYADMLHVPNRIFRARPEIAEKIQQGLSQILVDEFQDTNDTQLEFLGHCSGKGKAVSVFVVGDDDQSIYGWRGAHSTIFTDFLDTHKPHTLVRLEENYRCHSVVLDAANAVIAKNTNRIGKTLFTQRPDAQLIKVSQHPDGQAEAVSVAHTIRQLIESGTSPSAIAILFRKNSLSRLIEQSLLHARIPYQIFGGKSFFARKEIKDALAILRLLANPNDTDAFFRCMERPPKGVGQTTLDKIRGHAQQARIPLLRAAADLVTAPKFLDFLQLLKKLHELRQQGDFTGLIRHAVQQSGLQEYYLQKEKEKGEQRADNLRELVVSAWDFHHRLHMGEVILPDLPDISPDANDGSDPEPDPLLLFLAETALHSGNQQSGSNAKAPSVQVMTVHKSKGLEFPHVFVIGLEQGEFPSLRPNLSPPQIQQQTEEERRLFYVAVTRAMDELYLSFAVDRKTYDPDKDLSVPSQFFWEIPPHLFDRPLSSLTDPLALPGRSQPALPARKRELTLLQRHQVPSDIW